MSRHENGTLVHILTSKAPFSLNSHPRIQIRVFCVRFQSVAASEYTYVNQSLTFIILYTNLYHSLGKFITRKIDYIVLFLKKIGLTFHANRLKKCQTLFLRKILRNVV